MGKAGPRELALREQREERQKQSKSTKRKEPMMTQELSAEAKDVLRRIAKSNPVIVAPHLEDETCDDPSCWCNGNEANVAAPAQPPTSELQDMPKKKVGKSKKKVGKARKPNNGTNGHSNRSSKAAKIAEMLLRKEGCSAKEVLKATGWPTVSMPAQAKMVGLKLKKEKTDSGLRYYGSK
jgi:hypothetical protein